MIVISDFMKKHRVSIILTLLTLFGFMMMLSYWESSMVMSLVFLGVTAGTGFLLLKRLKPPEQYDTNSND